MPEPARTGTGDLHGGAARWPGIFFHETKDGRGVGETRAAHMTGIDSFSYIFRVPFLSRYQKAQADTELQRQESRAHVHKSSSEFHQGFSAKACQKSKIIQKHIFLMMASSLPAYLCVNQRPFDTPPTQSWTPTTPNENNNSTKKKQD